MNRLKIAKFSIFALFLGWAALFFIPHEDSASQQIDPFYTSLFEKAQRAFLAKKYDDAARQFEIASFGLTANKTLRAKACVYLGLCHYYLKNTAKSEDFLRQAYELVGEEVFVSLEIAESALPDLDKLLTLFNIRPAQQLTSAESTAQPKENQQKPAAQQKSQAQKENSSSSQKSPTKKVKETAKTSQEESQKAEPIVLDQIKEGDLIPLEMVETKPVAIRRIQPRYPPEALRAGIEGTVIVNALISETGAVIKTEVIKSMKGAFGLDQAAQRAVQQWKFEPATIKGIKVKVWMPVAMEFKKQ